MTLRTLAGHTIDAEILPEAPTVLDVGCREFDFAAGMRKLRPAKITCIDPDPEVVPVEGFDFIRAALFTTEGEMTFYRWFESKGNFVGQPDTPGWLYDQHARSCVSETITVPTVILAGISNGVWDVVKLDCEACEFPILENWPGPIAKQISVEFHDYMDENRWNDEYFKRLFDSLSQYDVLKHDKFEAYPGAMGHWDTLLVLK